MSIINKAAAIGGGVIGAGWVARLLLNGIDVSIFDPDPEASRKVGEVMKGARRSYKQMLPGGLPKESKLTFAKTIGEAVARRSGSTSSTKCWPRSTTMRRPTPSSAPRPPVSSRPICRWR